MTTMLTTTEAETLVADAHAVCALLPAHLGPNKTQSQILTECELIAKVWKTLHSVFDVHTHALQLDQQEVMRLQNTLKSINAIEYGKHKGSFSPSWRWYELV